MVADPLMASLLGRPRFFVAAGAIPFASKKALALFAYLVLNRKVHARRDLAALFWGDRGGESARANLRLVLHRLPDAMTACLAIHRESVGIAAGAPLECDVDRFEALARRDDLENLEAAAALYSDHLLKDLDAEATPEFDDWLHAERVRWEQRAQETFERVIALRAGIAAGNTARARPEREAALAVALRWTALMPGAEAAHRWLMRLYLDLGRRDAALAQFELCQRFLAVTHGRSPGMETRELYELGKSGNAFASDRAQATGPDEQDHHDSMRTLEHAAIAATPFIGRLEELAALNRLLDDPSARLITLHGMGGTGKTRLAHALATHGARRFADGIVWVALESAQSPDALPAALAGAMGHELPPHGDRSAALAAMFARRECLIVLDNVETLLAFDVHADDAEPRSVVLAILGMAKRCRILVTSREVLGVQEEWIYEVCGLPYAGAATTAGAMPPAVELFAQRARQAYLGFSLEAELPHVAKICELVEGLPLGIEIAAAWVRTIPCGEIAAAVEREALTLRSVHRNRPARQQSLDAVINYSWQLLTDEQREALAGLGLFVGGFTRDAAAQVAQAPLRTLSALIDKALVRRGREGRYDLHELVRQFALARLEDRRSQHKSAARRFVAVYRDLLLAIHERSRGPDELDATLLFRSELPNLLACLRHCLATHRIEVLEQIGAPLVSLLHTHGLVREALAAAEEAVGILEQGAHDHSLGPLRLQWGRAAITGGRPEVAKRQLNLALQNISRDAPEAIARCLYFRGAFHYQQGDIELAQRDADEAMRLSARSDNSELRSMCLNLQGSLANMQSRFEVAETQLREGLAAARVQGTPSQISILLCGLAVPLYYQGRLQEAAALTREAAAISEKLGKTPNAVFARGNLAAIELAMGAIESARQDAETAVRLARGGGGDSALSGCLATLGESLLKLGRLANARSAAEEGLQIAVAVGNMLQATHAHYVLASIDLRETRRDAALAHLRAMRSALAQHRLAVRIPMLILAASDWALTSDDVGERAYGRRWAEAILHFEGIDFTLRAHAREMLGHAETAHATASEPAADLPTLSEIEAEVLALLAAGPSSPALVRGN